MTREELPTMLRGMIEMLDGPQNEGNLVLPAILRGMREAADEIDSLQAQLAQVTAERDGRLVVLSKPMVPMVEGDDPMDTDVYCPRCGESLSGGWDDYHTDQEWKMCQCPNCGQSIDDTMTISKSEAQTVLEKMEGNNG